MSKLFKIIVVVACVLLLVFTISCSKDKEIRDTQSKWIKMVLKGLGVLVVCIIIGVIIFDRLEQQDRKYGYGVRDVTKSVSIPYSYDADPIPYSAPPSVPQLPPDLTPKPAFFFPKYFDKRQLLDNYHKSQREIIESSALQWSAIIKKAKPAVATIYAPSGESISKGTCYCLSKSGLVVTNSHVLQGGGEALLKFFDGREVKAELVTADDELDIAILIANHGHFEYLKLGDSSHCEQGHAVMAYGSPESYDDSATPGHISAIRWGERACGMRIIQHTCAINPGHSGGPLFNDRGEVVGMNTYKSATSEGLGFAISSNDINLFIEKVLKT